MAYKQTVIISIALEPGSPRFEGWQGQVLMRTLQVAYCHPLLMSSPARGPREEVSSLATVVRALIPFRRPPPSQPHPTLLPHFLTAPSKDRVPT